MAAQQGDEKILSQNAKRRIIRTFLALYANTSYVRVREKNGKNNNGIE